MTKLRLEAGTTGEIGIVRSSSGEFDVSGKSVGFGEDFAALAEVLEMVGDGVAEFLLDFRTGPAGGDAAGKIRGVGGVAFAGFFDDDQVLFHDADQASETGIRPRSDEACRKLSQGGPVTGG